MHPSRTLCPCCSKEIFFKEINAHLDSGCIDFQETNENIDEEIALDNIKVDEENLKTPILTKKLSNSVNSSTCSKQTSVSKSFSHVGPNPSSFLKTSRNNSKGNSKGIVKPSMGDKKKNVSQVKEKFQKLRPHENNDNNSIVSNNKYNSNTFNKNSDTVYSNSGNYDNNNNDNNINNNNNYNNYNNNRNKNISSNSTASTYINENSISKQPFAERCRPKTLDQFVGQSNLLGEDGILYKLIKEKKLPSMILWGPPGVGKTTIGKMLPKLTGLASLSLDAVNSGVTEVRNCLNTAKNNRTGVLKKKTILFIDEIHRFNKGQQDSLLAAVEQGDIILVGATTECPSFRINSALLSRCRIFQLNPFTVEEMGRIIKQSLGMNSFPYQCAISKDSVEFISRMSDGDARNALNIVDVAVQITPVLPISKIFENITTTEEVDLDIDTSSNEMMKFITIEAVKQVANKTHLLYDTTGEEHYNCISALHKSVRGSDVDASLYWLGRMLEAGEDPLYIARRLVRIASEDVGLADALALPQAVACYQGVQFVGMPESNLILAQGVVYLAQAPKSVKVYRAYKKVVETIKNQKCEPVPIHLRNAPTKLLKDAGYGAGYMYNPDYSEEECRNQTYLPENLAGTKFFVD